MGHGTCFWELQGEGTGSPEPEFRKVRAQFVEFKHSVLLSRLASVALRKPEDSGYIVGFSACMSDTETFSALAFLQKK